MLKLDKNEISEIVIYEDSTSRIVYKSGSRMFFIKSEYLTEVFKFCLENADETILDKETKNITFRFN